MSALDASKNNLGFNGVIIVNDMLLWGKLFLMG